MSHLEYETYRQLVITLVENGNKMVVNGETVLCLDDTVRLLDFACFSAKKDGDTLIWGSINIYALYGDELSRPLRNLSAVTLAHDMLGHGSTFDEPAGAGRDGEVAMSAVRSTGPERTIPVISNDEEICIMVGKTPTNFIFSDEVGVHLFGGQLAFIVVDGNHRTYGLRQLRTRA